VSVKLASDGAGRYRLSGELTFATVRDTLRAAQDKFAGETKLVIDLSAVSVADSAGLALLIEWYRLAAQTNKPIQFVGVPAQLRALAKISDVESFLPFAETATT